MEWTHGGDQRLPGVAVASADRQVIISPSWSLHSGVGTTAYSFVWAMAGENQAFDDMDAAPVTDLR